MSTTPPDTEQPAAAPGPDTGPRVTWDEIRDLAAIRRTTGPSRRLAGVAGGIARHLDIDPLIVRVAFVVLTFFGGAGLLLYIASWLLVPEENSDWARVPLDRRSRNVALILTVGLVAVILAGHTWWGSGYPWWILITAGVVALIATAFPRRDRGAAPPPPPPGGAASGMPLGAAPTATYGAAPVPPYGAAPVPPPMRTTQPRPVNPRKRGPILFLFALAVMAVSLGVLAVVDLAGAPVAPSTYPAVVLALSGIFLVIGSFWGRAGGIILIGLIAVMTTVGVTIADRWDPHNEVNRPTTSAAVQDSYHLDAGRLVVDLTHVTDPRELDGREIHVSGGVGQIDVRVPEDVTAVVVARVSGPGGIDLFDANLMDAGTTWKVDGPGGVSLQGHDSGGVDTTTTVIHSGGPNAPRITLRVDLHVGVIRVGAEPAVRGSLR